MFDFVKSGFLILNENKKFNLTKNKKMEDFKKRLQAEKKDLSVRMEKLRDFMGSEGFTKIDPVQMTLLNIQVKAMETYSQCLLERIVRLDVE